MPRPQPRPSPKQGGRRYFSCASEGGGSLTNVCSNQQIAWEWDIPVFQAGEHTVTFNVNAPQFEVNNLTSITCGACSNNPNGTSFSCLGQQPPATTGVTTITANFNVPTSSQFGGNNAGGPVYAVCIMGPNATVYNIVMTDPD